MAEETYIVNYFDVRGLAEPARFILSYGGAKWEDKRIPFSSFPPSIPAELKARLPYGQVPFLEFGKESLSQASSIARFLARKYDLVGDGDLDAARCDEIVDACKDLLAVWMPIYSKYVWTWTEEGDQAEKEEALKKVVAESKERFLSKFNAKLAGNEGHLVGKRLTWADIFTAHYVDNIQIGVGVSLTEGLPELAKLIQTVYNTPGIKEWVEKRPKTQL